MRLKKSSFACRRKNVFAVSRKGMIGSKNAFRNGSVLESARPEGLRFFILNIDSYYRTFIHKNAIGKNYTLMTARFSDVTPNASH